MKKQAVKKPPAKKQAAKKPAGRSRTETRTATAEGQPGGLSCRAHADCRVLVFGTSCTIDEVGALRGALLDHLREGKPLVLDACAIEHIDTAGMQLLVGLSIDCMERGIPFCWKAQSAPLKRAMAVLGVGALMESPNAIEQFAALAD